MDPKLALLILVLAIAGTALLTWWVMRPDAEQADYAYSVASRAEAKLGNHADMAAILGELIYAHENSYLKVFTTPEKLHHAKSLLAAYQQWPK
jgi:hypothetical protein